MAGESARLPRRYRYKYSLTLQPWGRWEHSYELIGPRGGLHFHISDLGDALRETGGPRYTSGLEVHFRAPPDYMADQPPSQDRCWLLNCPCWHDGTSLYADEHLLPMWEQLRDDPEAMFRQLTGEADRRFVCEDTSDAR